MSEQTSVKQCCASGHIHQGTPKGETVTIHGLETYVTGAKASPSTPTIIFIPDIFGVYPNAKLLADTWAELGNWRVVIPDVFQRDPVSLEHLKTIVPNTRDMAKRSKDKEDADQSKTMEILGPWLEKHSEANVRPNIEKFVKGVKAESSKTAAVGFCWGGRYAVILGSDAVPADVRVDAVVANHPSFLSEKDVAAVKNVPVAIFWGDKDAMLPADQLDAYESTLTKALGKDKVLVERYANAVHGFTIRGDDMNDKEKKDKEDAAAKGVEFVKKAFA